MSSTVEWAQLAVRVAAAARAFRWHDLRHGDWTCRFWRLPRAYALQGSCRSRARGDADARGDAGAFARGRAFSQVRGTPKTARFRSVQEIGADSRQRARAVARFAPVRAQAGARIVHVAAIRLWSRIFQGFPRRQRLQRSIDAIAAMHSNALDAQGFSPVPIRSFHSFLP
ncbi:hypothetical protein J5226_00890 [Lysobacter sp. K5869]|uniref:hypothetical protein n=1 Tax=Lysobacter sp. K5869 TaxID=2820808 RepID=UPI001C05F00B|nr:hypothetical protein [Lysobacter sp. K5869]QWP76996.1 hypothetical protein J5226_00890 [Lysobacter sp. K5869]